MKNAKTTQKLTKEISKKYGLCNFCFSRLTSKKNTKSIQKCYICKNIFQQIDDISTRILESMSLYEFSNFETGIILKPSVIDRDDHIKSEFQIKGVNSIKASVNHEISKKLARKIKSEIKHKNSDIRITVNFKDDSYEIHSRPLSIYGRYIKKTRMLTQKRHNCTNCLGKGCHSCNFHGLENFNSVDGKITKFLIDKFDCQQVKINWIGGEEKSSLVLGNGRPFFAKITNPKKRKRILRTKIQLEGIQLLELRKIKTQPKGQIAFKSNIEIIIKTSDHIKDRILTDLEQLDMPLHVHINGKKTTLKRIYKMKFKKTAPKLLKVNMYADGGIPIKSLIQSSDIVPNFTELLQNECECIQFDFKKIDVVS
jgi:tRNA pseudouridine synthase 10